jgi:hypothetical protein
VRPGLMASRKHLGGRGSAAAQPSGDAFALASAILADSHRRAPGEFPRPGRHGFVRSAHRARNKAWIGGEGVFVADVDQSGAVRHAYQAPKLIRQYAVE